MGSERSRGSAPYAGSETDSRRQEYGQRPVSPARSGRSRGSSARSVPVSQTSHRGGSETRGYDLYRPGTGVSEVASAMSRGSRRSASTGRSSASSQQSGYSGLGELPRPSQWQVPTRSVLGGDQESSRSISDTSSVRTATTVREFFDEDRRWAASSENRRSGRGYMEGRPPRPTDGPLRRIMADGGNVPHSVLPCVPPGKVPGGRPDPRSCRKVEL
ncbi:unnamed protein product [Polarella glacialis]|uniref:Uncharacterized protein n=1 Tax=Polarella glacialis TaxID=89957 RepID=A0A813H0N6_POLGL|nr:unnamed protein product [Polarella glacialis]